MFIIKLLIGGKSMRMYPLIGGSIFAVALLVLGSLTNVVGFQSVQSLNQKVINDTVDQKELLFQTILDIANNKEIQKIILNSEIRREGFFTSEVEFSKGTPQVLTKDSLNRMYLVGVMLSKIISKSRMHSMIERFRGSNHEIQNEINAVIIKDSTLNREITQLLSFKCDCGNENTTSWNFPVLCFLLIPFLWLALVLYFAGGITFLGEIVGAIGSALHCSWV
jgi:hypothetical protein